MVPNSISANLATRPSAFLLSKSLNFSLSQNVLFVVSLCRFTKFVVALSDSAAGPVKLTLAVFFLLSLLLRLFLPFLVALI